MDHRFLRCAVDILGAAARLMGSEDVQWGSRAAPLQQGALPGLCLQRPGRPQLPPAQRLRPPRDGRLPRHPGEGLI